MQNCEICGQSPTSEVEGHWLCPDCVTKAVDYKARLEARYERWQARAAKAEAEASTAFTQAHAILDPIPFGQPILVGHHSEGKHRRALAKHDSAMRRGIAAQKRAEELSRRRLSTAISSDSPTAILELQDKIAEAEKAQALMKAANKTIRRYLKVEGDWQKRTLPWGTGIQGFPLCQDT